MNTYSCEPPRLHTCTHARMHAYAFDKATLSHYLDGTRKQIHVIIGSHHLIKNNVSAIEYPLTAVLLEELPANTSRQEQAMYVSHV